LLLEVLVDVVPMVDKCGACPDRRCVLDAGVHREHPDDVGDHLLIGLRAGVATGDLRHFWRAATFLARSLG
jgi:hypothetical protein